MDNVSLKHEARARQSRSAKPEISNNKQPDSGAFDDILQAMTFSLTFTSSQWRLFWRLLNVGCMLADELLDLVTNPDLTARPGTALLWNQLSSELAALLKKDEICVTQEEEQRTTR